MKVIGTWLMKAIRNGQVLTLLAILATVLYGQVQWQNWKSEIELSSLMSIADTHSTAKRNYFSLVLSTSNTSWTDETRKLSKFLLTEYLDNIERICSLYNSGLLGDLAEDYVYEKVRKDIDTLKINFYNPQRGTLVIAEVDNEHGDKTFEEVYWIRSASYQETEKCTE